MAKSATFIGSETKPLFLMRKNSKYKKGPDNAHPAL
jgi:hypothetical protein